MHALLKLTNHEGTYHSPYVVDPFLQIPLITITTKMNKLLKNEQAGNIFFWFVFCIFGQPMGLLMYMHDYSVQQMQLKG